MAWDTAAAADRVAVGLVAQEGRVDLASGRATTMWTRHSVTQSRRVDATEVLEGSSNLRSAVRIDMSARPNPKR